MAQTPPPIPTPSPPPAATFTPLPEPTAYPSAPPTAVPTVAPLPGKHGRRRNPQANATATPVPTATPTSPAFASLDGTWELQVQYPDHTLYSHFVLRQKDANLTGSWRTDGKDYAFEGTYDGRLIHIVVKKPTGEVSLSGYVENASDMVGLVDWGAGKSTPFTAEHRGPPPAHGLLQKY